MGGPIDEQCHAWLVQLLAGMRADWEDASIQDREQYVEELEEAARFGVAGCHADPAWTPLAPSSSSVSPANLHTLLADVSLHGNAARVAYRAWSLRAAFAKDLQSAAVRREQKARATKDIAANFAELASGYAAELDARALKQRSLTQDMRVEWGARLDDLKEQLASMAPATQQIQREIEEAETTHRELLRQVGQLSEKLEVLRRRKADAETRGCQLRSEVQRVESTFATKVSSEDEDQWRTQCARALAVTVGDLASELVRGEVDVVPDSVEASMGDSCDRECGTTVQEVPPFTDSFARTLAVDADRSRVVAAAAAFELAEREAVRLRAAAHAAELCAAVAEDRVRSREVMEQMGVPVMTLESDVVGEAEIAQSIRDALTELDRCRPDVETLVAELVEGAATAGSQVALPRARSLASMLSEGIEACTVQRKRLTALANDTGEEALDLEDFSVISPTENSVVEEHAAEGSTSHDAQQPQPRLQPQPQQQHSNPSVLGLFGNLAARVGAGRRASERREASEAASVEEVIDPFLLEGIDGDRFPSEVGTETPAVENALDGQADSTSVAEELVVRNLDTGEVHSLLAP